MEPHDELNIPDDILEQLQKPDDLMKFIDDGRSLQEIIGYSDSLMEDLYQAACEVFREGKHEEAQDGFLFLTTLNPYVYAYWLGLAMTHQLLEEYEQAIVAYESASKIESEAPMPCYYLAGCYLLLNRLAEAQKAIDLARAKCAEKPEYKALLEKVEKAEAKIRRRNH